PTTTSTIRHDTTSSSSLQRKLDRHNLKFEILPTLLSTRPVGPPSRLPSIERLDWTGLDWADALQEQVAEPSLRNKTKDFKFDVRKRTLSKPYERSISRFGFHEYVQYFLQSQSRLNCQLAIWKRGACPFRSVCGMQRRRR